MQRELEEARMQHEVKLLNLQQENDRVRKEIKRRGDSLREFQNSLMQINHTHNFCRFEESMKEADIAKKEWPLRLDHC